jgi:hypothetical protein
MVFFLQEYRPPTVNRAPVDPEAKKKREEDDYFARARSKVSQMKVGRASSLLCSTPFNQH